MSKQENSLSVTVSHYSFLKQSKVQTPSELSDTSMEIYIRGAHTFRHHLYIMSKQENSLSVTVSHYSFLKQSKAQTRSELSDTSMEIYIRGAHTFRQVGHTEIHNML